MANDIYLYVPVSLGLVVIALMLYVVVRLLDWSRNKALRWTEKRVFKKKQTQSALLPYK